MAFIDTIKAKAKADKKTIVLPESMDKRTFEAAEKILKEGIANLVIIGTPEEIEKNGAGYDLTGATIVDPFTDPNRQKYSLKYYTDLAKQMQDAGANIIAIKDMAGLLKPEAAYALISALKDAVDLPIHLHSHEGGGCTLYSYAKAVDAGVDILDVATGALSGG